MELQTELCTYVDFDYKYVRVKYLAKMDNYLSLNVEDHYTPSKIQQLIEDVKKYKDMQEKKLTCYPVKINKYMIEVAVDGDEEILLFKNSTIQIISYGDCFDVFVDLHLRTSHGRFEVMYNTLRKYFYFPISYLECFLESCNVCVHKKMLNNKKPLPLNPDVDSLLQAPTTSRLEFNSIVNIAFLSMDNKYHNANNLFKYVLIYNEKSTDYTLLRPLVALDKEEVALEIYKIFIDFGHPETIHTSNLDLLVDVMKLLDKMPVKFFCQVLYWNLETLEETVDNRLNAWLRTSNSANWATGCYIVQIGLNSEKTPTPSENLFGKNIIGEARDSKSTYSSDSSRDKKFCNLLNYKPGTSQSQNTPTVTLDNKDNEENSEIYTLHTEEDLGVQIDGIKVKTELDNDTFDPQNSDDDIGRRIQNVSSKVPIAEISNIEGNSEDAEE